MQNWEGSYKLIVNFAQRRPAQVLFDMLGGVTFAGMLKPSPDDQVKSAMALSGSYGSWCVLQCVPPCTPHGTLAPAVTHNFVLLLSLCPLVLHRPQQQQQQQPAANPASKQQPSQSGHQPTL
jgi:hypothetical protein